MCVTPRRKATALVGKSQISGTSLNPRSPEKSLVKHHAMRMPSTKRHNVTKAIGHSATILQGDPHETIKQNAGTNSGVRRRDVDIA
jgi:hypothetical protein